MCVNVGWQLRKIPSNIIIQGGVCWNLLYIEGGLQASSTFQSTSSILHFRKVRRDVHPFFSSSTFFFALSPFSLSDSIAVALSLCSSEAHAEYRPRHLSMSTATYTPGRFHSYSTIFRIRRAYAHPFCRPFPPEFALAPPATAEKPLSVI